MSTAARSPSGTRSAPRARACSRRCSTPSRTRSRRPGSPPSAWVAVTQWPSAWRCSDAGGHSRHVGSAAHAPPQRSRAARRSPRRGRGAARAAAPRHPRAGDATTAGGAARGWPAGAVARRGEHDPLPRTRGGWATSIHPVRPHRKRRERRTTRDAALRDRRSAEAGHRDPGLATQRESVPRAPMTARVSFAARAKGTGAAVAWIVGFALVGGAASWALDQVRPHSDPRWWLAWGSLASVVGFGLATWLVGFVLDRPSWDDLGWRPRPGVLRGWALGFGVGAGMASAAVGLAVAARRAVVTARGEWPAWSAAALPLGAGFLLAALTEELMFRGYPLRRLANAVGAGPATAVGALGFGLAHLGNPGATAFSTVNVALAGVWLACAFFSPGGMPLGWGAHFGWNAALALGVAAPVSGYAFPLPAVEYRPGRDGWVGGGAVGPAGGIVSTLVMLAGTTALVAWSRTARTPEPAA